MAGGLRRSGLRCRRFTGRKLTNRWLPGRRLIGSCACMRRLQGDACFNTNSCLATTMCMTHKAVMLHMGSKYVEHACNWNNHFRSLQLHCAAPFQGLRFRLSARAQKLHTARQPQKNSKTVNIHWLYASLYLRHHQMHDSCECLQQLCLLQASMAW